MDSHDITLYIKDDLSKVQAHKRITLRKAVVCGSSSRLGLWGLVRGQLGNYLSYLDYFLFKEKKMKFYIFILFIIISFYTLSFADL